MSVYEPLEGVVGAIINAALSRTVRRDVPTSRRGELEFFASRHFPFLVDQMVNRTPSKRIPSGASTQPNFARGVVSRHRTHPPTGRFVPDGTGPGLARLPTAGPAQLPCLKRLPETPVCPRNSHDHDRRPVPVPVAEPDAPSSPKLLAMPPVGRHGRLGHRPRPAPAVLPHRRPGGHAVDRRPGIVAPALDVIVHPWFGATDRQRAGTGTAGT